MKKTLSIFILLFALIIQSCSNDDNESEALKPVDFSVSLKYDVTFNSQVVKKASVTIVNTETANKYTVESDESGVATFKQILPGTYTITATKVIASAEFTNT